MSKKKRSRAADDEPEPPPTIIEPPSEWSPLVESLSRCASAAPSSASQPAIAKVLLHSLQLHHAMNAPHNSSAPTLASLLPTGAIRHPDVALYERVRRASNILCRGAEEQLASSAGAAAPRDGETLRSGPPASIELAPSAATANAAVGGAHDFRDVYMNLLAEGAPDELDALRREEPPMDEAALAQLVQALEGGAAAFSAVQRPLLSASFADSAEGASATPLVGDDAWTAAASERASEAREGGTPALVARVREVRSKR